MCTAVIQAYHLPHCSHHTPFVFPHHTSFACSHLTSFVCSHHTSFVCSHHTPFVCSHHTPFVCPHHTHHFVKLDRLTDQLTPPIPFCNREPCTKPARQTRGRGWRSWLCLRSLLGGIAGAPCVPGGSHFHWPHFRWLHARRQSSIDLLPTARIRTPICTCVDHPNDTWGCCSWPGRSWAPVPTHTHSGVDGGSQGVRQSLVRRAPSDNWSTGEAGWCPRWALGGRV